MKSKTIYVCQNCGAKETKWVGRCPTCGEWNSFEEEVEIKAKGQTNILVGKSTSKALRLSEVKINADERINTGDGELNRVLGGGLVPGSMILLGGEPGIGKSTLVLQFALHNNCGRILYVSGEESIAQIKMRAQRLGIENDECLFLSGNSLEMVLEHSRKIQPHLLIIDSIQTLATENIDAIPGSLSQIRECTNSLLRYSKENTISTILIGHITKDGQLAGPKILEHMVDTVLHFEGDQQYMYRILRSLKNRFGSTSEIGIYEMLQSGLRQVSNPSELLLSNYSQELSGIAVSATIEGIRPILLEVQALVSTAAYGVPQRSATGFDSRRLNMLLAVLEKRVGFRLATKDVFLNIAGGIRVNDPALDLAVVMAILSSNMDTVLPHDTVFAGEVGLSGEIRAVSRIEQRISEAEKLGFQQIFVPKGNQKSLTKKVTDIQIRFVSKITDICRLLFG
ncbi:DNA repair protein RadA [Odoribacter laneus]|jgi:DNA repair protein radA|uniref:DNA repair protein RadA n=1 Tax=Odoribacter laneus YIT 12061 TaxID=742817 RepID=H1DLF8_9BACT|nr:DNA repair protein RadA [Odoribacter laneus]EHP44954.1 DNA repair protein RadA [Odoribacter laneus YIT 12061]MBS1447188.1 DNA repair protein RadA [Odoribacter sp.]GKI23334.1 DNA repair protein RadA [Odoribacter laneus]GKI25434.1 DNA repair protein RadA [Odoribacter laneus]